MFGDLARPGFRCGFQGFGLEILDADLQDDGHALLELVKLGGFVTMLPKFTVGDRPNLCVVDLPPPGIQLSIGLMWTQLNAASSAFFEIATKTGIS